MLLNRCDNHCYYSKLVFTAEKKSLQVSHFLARHHLLYLRDTRQSVSFASDLGTTKNTVGRTLQHIPL